MQTKKNNAAHTGNYESNDFLLSRKKLILERSGMPSLKCWKRNKNPVKLEFYIQENISFQDEIKVKMQVGFMSNISQKNTFLLSQNDLSWLIHFLMS